MRNIASRQRGMTLIESVVALVVAVIGILGIVGMQVRTLADTQTTVRRAQAARLIEDLSERLHVNPNALGNPAAYVSTFADTPAVATSCQNSECSQAQLAAYDLAIWKQAVSSMLPMGQAQIFLAPENAANRRQLGVLIAWRENEKDTSADYKDAIDITTGAGVNCPDNFTCHLQYIAVAGRCAPFLGGAAVGADGAVAAATQYYCS